MLAAILTVTAFLSRREPRGHPGPLDTRTLFTASPTTQGIANGG